MSNKTIPPYMKRRMNAVYADMYTIHGPDWDMPEDEKRAKKNREAKDGCYGCIFIGIPALLLLLLFSAGVAMWNGTFNWDAFFSMFH